MSDLAIADATLRAASAGLRDALRTAWARASDGDPVTKAVQARVLLAGHHACDTAVDVTATAHRLGGGPAAYVGSPLLRSLTDAQTARQHALFSRHGRVMLGKAMAGLDVAAPPFIL